MCTAKSGNKAGSVMVLPHSLSLLCAEMLESFQKNLFFSFFFFYSKVEIGIKLHNILAAIFVSCIHIKALLTLKCCGLDVLI